MHHAFSLIFHIMIFRTYGLYFLPGSNFAPFEEVKVPVSNSAEFFSQKKCPLEDFGGFGVVGVDTYPKEIPKPLNPNNPKSSKFIMILHTP